VIRTLGLILIALAGPGLCVKAGAGQWHFDGVERIVALSDIHGAYDAMVGTLQSADVIDDEGAWAGGATHLVITGDILDRGPDSRSAMDLLMRLEDEAAAAGGRVHVLLGNHEAMNLMGDLRYVSIGEYSTFAGDETQDERDRWFQVYGGSNTDDGSALTMEAFNERFPPGFFAHRRGFRADGQYGKWLLGKPVMVVINGTAFVHGGVHPGIVDIGLDGINGRLVADLGIYVAHIATLVDAGVLLPSHSYRDQMRLLDDFMPAIDTPQAVLDVVEEARRLQGTSLIDLGEPLWYRGNVGCSRIVEEHRLESALASIGATRLVIGHTPTASRQVLQRFDGTIVEIDTGMLNPYYGGKGHALIIEGDDLTVVAQTGAEFDDPFEHPRRVGSRPGGMTAAELETLLGSGDIVARRENEEGQPPRSIVSVSDGEQTVDAIFVKRPRKGFYPNVAAYRLDKILGLGMVPVSVRRDVDGADGSLQFLPSKTMDEAQRSASGRGASAWCPLQDQWQAMYLFDALIYNEGRSTGRMVYSPDRWQLVLIEHQKAFSTKKGVPRHLESAPLAISPGWREALQRLDADFLTEQLGDVLDKSRLRSLDKRRANLLATPE